MSRTEEIIRNALENEGVAAPGWRIEWKALDTGSYNYCEIEIKVYQPRCRKPDTIWSVPFDMTRNLLWWNRGQLLYNRAW